MAKVDKVDDDKFLEVAKRLGYDPQKLNEREEYKTRIAELDLWDVSKILFFGRTWERY